MMAGEQNVRHAHAAQLLRAVMGGQLRARSPDPERTKIDPQLVGGLARLGKRLRLEHSTDAHVDALEVRDLNEGSLDQQP